MTQEYKAGTKLHPRKSNGQFKSKKFHIKTAFLLGFFTFSIVAFVIVNEVTLAKVMGVMESQNEKYVNVTAEVPVDCTSPTHIYTEECLQRLTDDVAGSFADLKRAEETLQQAQHLYDTAFEAHNDSIERLNTIMK